MNSKFLEKFVIGAASREHFDRHRLQSTKKGREKNIIFLSAYTLPVIKIHELLEIYAEDIVLSKVLFIWKIS